MKAPVLMALSLSLTPWLMAGEVQPGDTMEEVQAVMGAPKGRVKAGARHVTYYERGEVEFRGGRVVRVALRTPDEQAARDAREEAERAEREVRREQRVSAGTELRDRKLADESFRSAPLAYQISFWENFARSYPEVSCGEALTIVRLRWEEQTQEKARRQEQEDRLAEREQRVAAAEQSREYYPVRVFSPQYRHHHHQEFGFGNISYTFYDAPRPVYTSPSAPAVNAFTGDLAQPVRREYRSGSCEGSQPVHRRGYSGWREAERGRAQGRNRM